MSAAVRQLGGRRLASTAALTLLFALLVLGGWLWAPPARADDAPPPITIPLFPTDNPWNTDISQYPVDANSDAYIASIGADVGLHPDFGTDWDGGPIGIPYVVVRGTQPKIPITFYYADESDPGPYPIPTDVPIEGGPNSDGDRHVILLDTDNHLLYEVYDAHKWAATGRQAPARSGISVQRSSSARLDLGRRGWPADSPGSGPLRRGCRRRDQPCPALHRPGDPRAYVYPATHFASDSTAPSLPPMGLRLRLKAGYDIWGFPAEVQVILRALKKYGMIVADNGSPLVHQRRPGFPLERRRAPRAGRGQGP